MEPIILVLLGLPILILYYKNHKRGKTQKLKPPSPPGLPIVGNLFQFDAKYPHICLWRLSQKYGPIMSMKLGFRQVVVISSSDVVKEIMKSHDLTISSRPIMKGLQKLSYNGLDLGFSPYNDSWRELRKISTLHLFSLKKVNSFRPIREEEVSRMIRKISEDASQSKVTNMSEISISLTSNITCRSAFGKSYGDEGFEKSRFFHLLRETQAMLVALYPSDYFPWLGWIDKITGMDARLDKIFWDLDAFYNELIEAHFDPNRPESMRGDMLDILLELKRDQMTPMDLTIDHIKGVIMNVFAGGTDTSAAALVWAMTALMQNPSIMKKAQAEINELVSRKNKDFMNEDDIAKLPYLRAIVKETMRLYPSTPLLAPRETIQKCTINGYQIQAGTLVHLNAWAVARDPEIWKDPEEFFPERFLGSDIDVRGRDPEVIPFGIGRRGCPGAPMAIASIELAMANLLYGFNWEMPPGMKAEDIDYDVVPGITMHKKNALCLVAKPVLHA